MPKIEITKSRNFSVQIRDFHPVSWFVSAKVEVEDTPGEIKKAEEKLAKFCNEQIVKDYNKDFKAYAKMASNERKQELLNDTI